MMGLPVSTPQAFVRPVFVTMVFIVLSAPVAAVEAEEQQQKTISMPQDLPAFSEIDPLHEQGDLIRRYFLTSQGMRGQTVPLVETEGWFCTLSQATHVMLDFWPNLGHWAFQVGFDEGAELAAGGLATCHELPNPERRD